MSRREFSKPAVLQLSFHYGFKKLTCRLQPAGETPDISFSEITKLLSDSCIAILLSFVQCNAEQYGKIGSPDHHHCRQCCYRHALTIELMEPACQLGDSNLRDLAYHLGLRM